MVSVLVRRRPRRTSRLAFFLAVSILITLINTGILSFRQDKGLKQTQPLLFTRPNDQSQTHRSNVDVPAEGEVRIPKVIKPDWLGDEWKDEQCIPFDKWQLMEYGPSSCNMMHEMDIAEPGELNFINCGTSRCAFSITNELDEKVILKWTKLQRYEKPGKLEAAWKDTIAMERLQGSKYILNIYGNCGSSQMVEVAAGGALYDQMVVAKNTENAPNGLLNDAESNLRVSYHVARAVADLHSIDGTDATSFIHDDICCDQYLFVDGVFKLNDFNRAQTQLRNQTTGLGCKDNVSDFFSGFAKLRAPEEVLHPRFGQKIHRDKVDVWMMGDVIYYALTKKWVMEGHTSKEAVELVSEGKRSTIPTFIKKSKDPAHQAMIHAIDMAWTQDPDERPAAWEIAAYLEQQLIAINGGKSDAPWRVSARPLPPDYDFSAERPKNAIPGFIGWYDNYE